jgi:aspartate racemase
METRLFDGVSSADVVVPVPVDLARVHSEYIKIATSGKINTHQRKLFFEIGKKLRDEQGAEVILLAGTDLFLAFNGYDCGFSVIDSALVHIEALVNMS